MSCLVFGLKKNKKGAFEKIVFLVKGKAKEFTNCISMTLMLKNWIVYLSLRKYLIKRMVYY
jgi:hypothetical protein